MAAPTKAKVIGILKTSPETKKINFDFNGVKIWPGAYDKVADAIDSGKIKLVVGSLDPNTAGTYDPETDTLTLNSSVGIEYLGPTIIHEATHAYIDILSSGPISLATTEGCAYLAESTYDIQKGLSVDSFTATITLISRPIATNIVLSGKYTVPQRDVLALEGAIVAHPLYSGKASVLTQSNGFTRNILADLRRSSGTQLK